MVVSKTRKYLFDSLFALLLVTLIVKSVVWSGIPELIPLGILIFMACVGSREQVIAVGVACAMLFNIINCDYVLLAVVINLAVRFPKMTKVDVSCIPFCLIILIELMHGFSGSFSIKQLVGNFAPLIFCFVLLWQEKNALNYRLVVRMMSVCVVTLLLILILGVLIQANFNLTAAFSQMQRLGMHTEDTSVILWNVNPNTLGIMCVLATTGLLQILLFEKGEKTDIILLSITLLCGLLTLSRTFLILAVMMIGLVILSLQKAEQFRKKIGYVCLVVMLVAVIAVLLFPGAMEKFVLRFKSDDNMGGRGDLFRFYNQYLSENLGVMLFGIGLMDFGHKIRVVRAISISVPHNGIQELIMMWGIPGLILVGWFLMECIGHAKRINKRMMLVNYIPLILLLTKSMVGQMMSSGYTVTAFAYAYMSLAHNFEKIRHK